MSAARVWPPVLLALTACPAPRPPPAPGPACAPAPLLERAGDRPYLAVDGERLYALAPAWGTIDVREPDGAITALVGPDPERAGARGLAVGDGWVYWARGDAIVRVATGGGPVDPVLEVADPRELTYLGGELWITRFGGPTVRWRAAAAPEEVDARDVLAIAAVGATRYLAGLDGIARWTAGAGAPILAVDTDEAVSHVAASARYLYWHEAAPGAPTLRRRPLAGGPTEVLATLPFEEAALVAVPGGAYASGGNLLWEARDDRAGARLVGYTPATVRTLAMVEDRLVAGLDSGAVITPCLTPAAPPTLARAPAPALVCPDRRAPLTSEGGDELCEGGPEGLERAWYPSGHLRRLGVLDGARVTITDHYAGGGVRRIEVHDRDAVTVRTFALDGTEQPAPAQ